MRGFFVCRMETLSRLWPQNGRSRDSSSPPGELARDHAGDRENVSTFLEGEVGRDQRSATLRPSRLGSARRDRVLRELPSRRGA
jgi:hypothetical protein